MNRTSKYFFIPFTDESYAFINNYNACHNNNGLRIYLDDIGYSGDSEDCLFVCFDKVKIHKFEERLNFFKFCDSYVNDYEVSANQHIIIFRIHKKYRHTKELFLSGQYSKMYSDKIIESHFSNHSGYYLKYKHTPISVKSRKLIEKENVTELFIDNEYIIDGIISLEDTFKDIVLSPYHVLKKSKELQFILSKLYNVNIEYIDELDSIPLEEQEIFRFKEIIVK